MSLETLGIQLRVQMVLAVSWVIENMAKIMGYPEKSLGMPAINPDRIYGLKLHNPQVPPWPDPKTILESIFGNVPQSSPIEKFYYANTTDGYYNFYIDHYSNVLFLPDWLSEWLQLHFDLGVDCTSLEIIRDTLFTLLVYMLFLVQLRSMLFFFATINPYTRPWIYLVTAVDWLYDVLYHLGLTKRMTFYGFPLIPIAIAGISGAMADALNHLVFTMPYLPSEGTAGKMLVDGILRDVIVFRYLPSLWYTDQIPNELRKFWYEERPDIYQFMKKSYGQLGIDILPDGILEDQSQFRFRNILNIFKTITMSLPEDVEKIKILSTEVTCNCTMYCHEFSHYLIHKQEILTSSFWEHIDKLVW